MRPRLLLAAVVLLFLVLWFSRQGAEEADVAFFSGQTMGTSYQIQVATASARLSPDDQQTLDLAIAERLRELDKEIFSTWADASEISRLNQAAAPATLPASREMIEVSRMAREVYELSGGAFDPTIMPLVNLWGFGPDFRSADIPSASAIATAMAGLDFPALQISDATAQITKLRPLTLDYSAIAKGYAVDNIAALLDERGFSDYLVEVGGEVMLSGEKAPGNEWRIGIETPQEGPREVYQAIGNNGRRLAIAGSGDYRNYFDHDGQRYSHEIDPTTGWPVIHDLVSVTVLHESAAMADALATAFMIMGEEATLQLATGRDLSVYLIMRADSGYRAVHSAGFAEFMRDLNTP